jgi:hypothetical protein
MHFDTPSFGTIFLAAVLGIAVMLVQRAKWVRTLREDMVKADPAQLERMPTFASMTLQFWIRDPRQFGWAPVPRPTSTADGSTPDESN